MALASQGCRGSPRLAEQDLGLVLANEHPIAVCKLSESMQQLLQPLRRVSNKGDIISIEQDKGSQQCQEGGMRTARGRGVLS